MSEPGPQTQNSTDHESVTPEAVNMTWLMEDKILPDTGPNAELSLAKMTLAPHSLSEAHRHPNCTEAVHILHGQIHQRIGQKWIIMQAGDTCLIPKDTPHQSRNLTDETAIMMLAYSSGTRIYISTQDEDGRDVEA